MARFMRPRQPREAQELGIQLTVLSAVALKTASTRHVLIVEDDEPIRAMLADLLRDAGYGVAEADSGTQGLRLLGELEPDLIVLDLMMPELSGWEFLNQSREQLDRLNLPVIVVSAIAGKSDYPSTLGVAGWFTKPLDIPRFLTAVARLMDSESSGGFDGVPRPKPARVLVIEDDRVIRDLLSDQLEAEGYAPEVAGSIPEARQQIQAQRPDLILLDLMLPVEDGWTFLRARRSEPSLARVPVVVISATDHARLLEAKELGADAFLSKPFDLDALHALVRSFAG
jgi:CheY-like chemotaxis protein